MNYDILMQGGMLLGQTLDKGKIRNILRVKRTHPRANIIVSTWEMSAEIKSIFDRISKYFDFSIIYNHDPGPLIYIDKNVKYVCNINRMIFSTYNGLVNCQCDYVIKIRTDSYFINDKIISKAKEIMLSDNVYHKRNTSYCVLEKRVINCNLFARMATGYIPYLFHPGDILFFGLKSDLLSIFSVKLANSDIFEKSSRLILHSLMRYVPEQYIWVSCIENHHRKEIYRGNKFYNRRLVEESEQFLVNNFIFYSADELGFVWTKHKSHYKNKGMSSVYDHNDWKRLYAKYIDKSSVMHNRNLPKIIINKVMMLYFLCRTTILKIPYCKRLAIKFFSKRE